MASAYRIQPQRPMSYVGIRRVVKGAEIGPAMGQMLPAMFQWVAQKGIAPASPPMSVYFGFEPDTMSFDMLAGFLVKPSDVPRIFGNAAASCEVVVAKTCQARGPIKGDVKPPSHPDAPKTAAGHVLHGALPVGEVVSYIHRGPYDQLFEAHSSVDQFIKSQGRTTHWPCWELYLTDPGSVPNPADWETEVVWPIR